MFLARLVIEIMAVKSSAFVHQHTLSLIIGIGVCLSIKHVMNVITIETTTSISDITIASL